MPMRSFIASLLLIPGFVAAEECVLADKSRVMATGRINQIRDIKKTLIHNRDKSRTCTVEFRAEVNGVWSPGFGQYTWRNDMPDSIACNNALETAKANLVAMTGNQTITNEKHLTCGKAGEGLDVIKVGQTIRDGDWTPDPRRPGSFWYQGSECRWFIETDVMGRDLYQWQGIVCRVRTGGWVVIDKF